MRENPNQKSRTSHLSRVQRELEEERSRVLDKYDPLIPRDRSQRATSRKTNETVRLTRMDYREEG